MSTELVAVTEAVAEFDRVAAGLAELESKYKGVVYEVTTTNGMTEAREARRAIREPRLEVERIRKAAKAPILALGKKLDSEAARITKALEELECPIHDQIISEEARKERERQAKVEAELKRLADLQERIAELRGNPTLSPTSGSSLIAQHIADLQAIAVDESFEELHQQALDAKDAGLKRLQDLHAAAVVHEAEQERIKSERAELARLREEQAKRDAEDRRRREEDELRAKAERDAEAARHAEQLKQQREESERLQRERQAVIDAENARVRAEQEATAQVERGRLAAERAENERVEREARERREAEERRLAAGRAELEREQEALRRAQEPKSAPLTRKGQELATPKASEIVRVLATHYRAHPDTVIEWLRTMDFNAKVMEDAAA